SCRAQRAALFRVSPLSTGQGSHIFSSRCRARETGRMAGFQVAQRVLVLALAASRSQAVRAAIRAAPGLIPDAHKEAAYAAAKHIARKAGETAGRIVPPG